MDRVRDFESALEASKSAERADSAFSAGAMRISITCCLRSERSMAVFRNATMRSDADRSRSESTPAAADGYVSPATIAISVTTTSNSSRVTPASSGAGANAKSSDAQDPWNGVHPVSDNSRPSDEAEGPRPTRRQSISRYSN